MIDFPLDDNDDNNDDDNDNYDDNNLLWNPDLIILRTLRV
jgi:hypothetical protein